MRKKKTTDLAAVLKDDPLLTPIADLQKRDGLSDRDVKVLRGKILKDSLEDPIGSAEHDLCRDDRRYKKWLKSVKEQAK